MLIASKRPYWVYPVLFSLFLSLNNFAVIAQPGNIKVVMPVEATKLYDAGKSALEAKNFSEAIRKFQLLNFKYPDHLYQENVQLYLIYCLQGEKQYGEAIKAVDLFIKNYPESTRYQDVLALKKILEKQNTQKKQKDTGAIVLLVAGVGVALIPLHFFFQDLFSFTSKGDKPSNSDNSKKSQALYKDTKAASFGGSSNSKLWDKTRFLQPNLDQKKSESLDKQHNLFGKKQILDQMQNWEWDPQKPS